MCSHALVKERKENVFENVNKVGRLSEFRTTFQNAYNKLKCSSCGAIG